MDIVINVKGKESKWRMMNSKILLSVKNLTAGYGKYNILEDISFDIMQGDYVGIVGPNGSGKSTLVKTLIGLMEKKSGDILLVDNNIKIGYLPQAAITTDTLFPSTVIEVVKMGLLLSKKFPKTLNKYDKQTIDDMLEYLGLVALKKEKIGNLSGGQQQRVLLARALVAEPKILILDEPTSALDPNIRKEFYDLIHKLNSEKNVTVMLVSHDIATIGEYTNKLMYLDRKLVFYGDYREFCMSSDMTGYFRVDTQHHICHQH